VYVAQRELKFVTKGENYKVIIYKPGDVIPDFDQWDIHAQRAHLNNEFVVQVEGKSQPGVKSATKAPSTEKKTKDGKVLSTVDWGPNGPPVEKKAKSKSEAKRLAVMKAKPAKAKAVKKAAPATEEIPCAENCGKTFKSAKAAKTHATLAHK
jgi:hypothetical protein